MFDNETDCVVFGVSKYVADYIGLERVTVRILFLIALVAGWSWIISLYIILALFI